MFLLHSDLHRQQSPTQRKLRRRLKAYAKTSYLHRLLEAIVEARL